MPDSTGIIERTVYDFQKIQTHMKNAKEENAAKTYEVLKKDYKSLKAVPATIGVELTDIDELKE